MIVIFIRYRIGEICCRLALMYTAFPTGSCHVFHDHSVGENHEKILCARVMACLFGYCTKVAHQYFPEQHKSCGLLYSHYELYLHSYKLVQTSWAHCVCAIPTLFSVRVVKAVRSSYLCTVRLSVLLCVVFLTEYTGGWGPPAASERRF
jgi:hypothetical protein